MPGFCCKPCTQTQSGQFNKGGLNVMHGIYSKIDVPFSSERCQYFPLQTAGLLQEIIKLRKSHFLHWSLQQATKKMGGWSVGPLHIACLVTTFHWSLRASRNMLEPSGEWEPRQHLAPEKQPALDSEYNARKVSHISDFILRSPLLVCWLK